MQWKCWFDQKLQRTRQKLLLQKQDPLCGCSDDSQHKLLEDSTPLQTLSKLGGLRLLKWKLGKYLSDFYRTKGTQNNQVFKKNLCDCGNDMMITTSHIDKCEKHTQLKSVIASRIKQSYHFFLEEVDKIDHLDSNINLLVHKMKIVEKVIK